MLKTAHLLSYLASKLVASSYCDPTSSRKC